MEPPIAKLEPRAYAVVAEGRRALLPPVGARQRLETLIDARLGAVAPSSPLAATRPLTLTARPFAVALGLSVAAAVLWFRMTPAQVPGSSEARLLQFPPRAASLTPSAGTPTSTPAPMVPEVATPDPAAPEAAAQAVPSADPQSARRVPDRLDREVALLAQATSDLHAGRADQALKSLDEHQRKFFRGTLAVERSALRAQALCMLNRIDEGRAELARLAPQSPAAGRAKQVCDR